MSDTRLESLSRRTWTPTRQDALICFSIATLLVLFSGQRFFSTLNTTTSQRLPRNAQRNIEQCAALKALPGPSPEFFSREASDRFEPGTQPTLITNATIFTGVRNGSEVINGDILLDKGIIKALGYVPPRMIQGLANLSRVNAQSKWVTPGLVDLHSHAGVFSAPIMSQAMDFSSRHGPVVPYLRSIDGFNTHDDAFRLAMAGGVTSVQALPGSGNAIGGQAFFFKIRPTSERSPSSMILEPPDTLNGTSTKSSSHIPWRHMKQACGENQIRYGTRMDSIWAFRSAYNEARKVKEAQDAYCNKVDAGLWDQVKGNFPESLQWEMLVDVLRGRVKISNHCYEAVDFDDLVRLTNEFKFNIASFHHASEAWLVPDLLKKTWGGIPAVAIFATNFGYKREAYRGSEFAPRVLADNGIPVVMKSDHPVINSRYLMHEAQQAHYFGLPANLALASVTSTPAKAAGMDHRIGILRTGYNADVVLWDSHPLRVGTTPTKVWIDGILQILVSPSEGGKDVIVGGGKEDPQWDSPPMTPLWTEERKQAAEHEGLPPLEGQSNSGVVVFENVRNMWSKGPNGIVEQDFSRLDSADLGVVVVRAGSIICAGEPDVCRYTFNPDDSTFVNLAGGSLAPGLMTYGSPLGTEEITQEPSTGDGALYNAFIADVPSIMGDAGGLVRAVDALKFSTRDALKAHRAGVTLATTSLNKITLFAGSSTILAGLSTTFRTGSAHALEDGAIANDVTALHVLLGRVHPMAGKAGLPWPSVSTQIAGIRRLLSGAESNQTETGYWFGKAAEGDIPFIVDVDGADVMATLLQLKDEIEQLHGTRMRVVFSGATEAHLLADEIAHANVGVILKPLRPFPRTWDQRRILPGPPLTNDTALVKLLSRGIKIGIGVKEAWEARSTRFSLAWAALESNGILDKSAALALATSSLESLLDLDTDKATRDSDMVAYAGGDAFDMASKIAGIISPARGLVNLL